MAQVFYPPGLQEKSTVNPMLSGLRDKDVSSREQTLNYEASQVDNQVRGLPERFPGKFPGCQGTEQSSGWQDPVASSASLQKCSKHATSQSPSIRVTVALKEASYIGPATASHPGKWEKGAPHRNHGGARSWQRGGSAHLLSSPQPAVWHRLAT